VEDFHRKRSLYQLTGAGQAAEQAIACYEEAIGRRGQLQSVALADIADQLRSLRALAAEHDPDPAKVHLLLLSVAERFSSLADNAQAAAVARHEASSAQAVHDALLATAGAAVEELYRQLDEVRRDIERRNAAEKAARGREQQAVGDRGRAEGKRETLRGEIDDAARTRDAAVAEFRSFAATGLLRVALPSLEIPDVTQPWAATPAVLLARAVNAGLESVDDADGPWDRIQRRVTEEHKLLADAMARHGHSAGLTLNEGVIVVDVVFQGRSHDIPGLAAALGEEAEQRARLLSAREREILENHLLNEVAGTRLPGLPRSRHWTPPWTAAPTWRSGGRGSTRPVWRAVSPPNLIRRDCSSPRSRRCSGGFPRPACPSVGSPPSAAAMRTPWTTGARLARWCCPRSARWPACRSPRSQPPIPVAPGGPPSEFTSTSCPPWCCVSACPATRAPPWAGRWRPTARRDSRQCSRSVSSAATRSL
jgi:hypothetical protein